MSFVSNYIKSNPCFYIEEWQEERHQWFGRDLKTIYATSIYVAVVLRIGPIKKRRAREAVPHEIEGCIELRVWYSYPDKFVFNDETFKNGLDVIRRYAWSRKGEMAVVCISFARRNWVYIVAARNTRCFFGWGSIRGTFTRLTFHRAFVGSIVC